MSPIKSRNGVFASGTPGFSLVELMFAMSLASMVMAAVISSYLYLGRNLTRLVNHQQMETQNRRALAMLNQDTRMAMDVSVSPDSQGRANAFSLTLPGGSNPDFTVTYTYNPGAKTLARNATGGGHAGNLTLISNLSVADAPKPLFRFLDKQASYASNKLSVKQIEVCNFTIANGTAASGTRSLYTGASARLILRNKYL